MAKILYITNGMASTLHSSFELARRLVAGGHTVSFTSHAPIAADVEARGYRYFALLRDQRLRERMVADPMPPARRLRPFVAWLRRRRELRHESIADRELEGLVERLAPDLLLIDIEMHAAIIMTDRFRLPTLLPIAWFTIYRHPGLPPLHTRLGPGAGRWAIELAWLRHRLVSALLRLKSRLWLPRLWTPLTSGTVNIGDLSALANSRGYPLNERTDGSQWLRPHLYRDSTMLSLTAREMDLPHQPHPDLRYVGPMIEEERREALRDRRSLAAWHRFLKARAAGPEKRPLVYCSLGSYWSTDRTFLRSVLAVFEHRTDWDLVLGLGGKLDVEQLAPIPANALLLRWAPQLEVLEEADCAITHGGIATINECIACGVPMVVYSTRHVDQDGCAVRVAYHGLGVQGDKDQDGASEIEHNVERALDDPLIRSSVAEMRQAFSGYRARDEVLQVVDQALAAGQRRSSGGAQP